MTKQKMTKKAIHDKKRQKTQKEAKASLDRENGIKRNAEYNRRLK